GKINTGTTRIKRYSRPLFLRQRRRRGNPHAQEAPAWAKIPTKSPQPARSGVAGPPPGGRRLAAWHAAGSSRAGPGTRLLGRRPRDRAGVRGYGVPGPGGARPGTPRSEEHTSELQSLAYLVC